MIYKTIDLCAGIGGIRRGFEMTGRFENVLSAEIDPFAAATYKHLFGDDPMNDLTSEDFKQKVDSAEYDVLLAGFPCQAFSRIGKKLGFRDATRGTIFFEIADIISRTNPRAVFLENVDNLVSHDGGNTIMTIVRTLEEDLGYRVIGVSLDEDGNYVFDRSSFVRNTKNFGLPQNRPRTYIMAFSKKKYGRAIRRLRQPLPYSSDEIVFEDVNAVMEKEVADKYYMAQGYLDTLKGHRERNHKKGNGFGYCVVNRDRDNCKIANTILATGGSGKERNLVYQPKDGISGKILKGKATPLNSEGIRMMTPTEWGRLQGFIGYGFFHDGVEEFSFPEGVSDGQKYKQFGNSVSIPVIRKMAEFMLECFETLEAQQEEVVRALAENSEFITRRDVMEMLDIGPAQAKGVLERMIQSGELVRTSGGRTIRYLRPGRESDLSPYSQEEKVAEIAKNKDGIVNQDIAEALGISVGSANALLSKMVQKGSIIRIDRGKYTAP